MKRALSFMLLACALSCGGPRVYSAPEAEITIVQNAGGYVLLENTTPFVGTATTSHWTITDLSGVGYQWSTNWQYLAIVSRRGAEFEIELTVSNRVGESTAYLEVRLE